MWSLLKKMPSPEMSGALLRQYTNDEVIADIFDPLDRQPVEELPCPSSGGEGCPRQVRELPDGTIIAVCGRYPQKCKEVPVDSTDRAIYGLNLKRVAAKIADSWSQHNVNMNVSIVNSDLSIAQIGFYNPRGTINFPIFFHIPYFEGDRQRAIEQISQNNEHFILLIPSTKAINSGSLEALKRRGSMMVGLEGSLPEDLFHEFDSLHPVVSKEEPSTFNTPPNAKWDEISITFIARDTVSIKCGKQPSANYERVQIPGMFIAHEDYKKPSDKWFLLMAFAQMGPYLSREDLDKVFLGKTNRKAQNKQKSQLSKTLKDFFGISLEPIPFSRKENLYKPRLVINKLNCDLTPWIAEMHE